MIELSVVILNWNGVTLLQRFLPSVVAFSSAPNIQIVVVDNCSTDESVTFITENYPQIKIVQLDKNYGFAGGYNLGLAQVSSEYYVLLNSDVEVTENWIEPVLTLMKSDKNIACAMPKIIDFTTKTDFEYAGAAGGFIDKYGFPFCRGRIFFTIETDQKQYDTDIDVFWATGAALFVKADDYFGAGGLDEDFFAHMEEIDLCWRLKNRGKRIVYCNNATVFHVGAGTLSKDNPRKTYLNFRNNLFLLYKNLNPENFRNIMFRRKLIDGFAAVGFLLKANFKDLKAVFKAHRHYYEAIPVLKKKRELNLSFSTVFSHKEIYKSSIVFAYFFKKKRKFTDLDFS
ncbi:MAG: glycosyltransferase family 2 protein [Bacteroidales bacterium]|nr:glycosyltransferase family 2 protein [Bacteroidales bacterium]